MLFFTKPQKALKTIILFNVPKCPYCGGDDVIDNGDNWYCYDCNATFGDH